MNPFKRIINIAQTPGKIVRAAVDEARSYFPHPPLPGTPPPSNLPIKQNWFYNGPVLTRTYGDLMTTPQLQPARPLLNTPISPQPTFQYYPPQQVQVTKPAENLFTLSKSQIPSHFPYYQQYQPLMKPIPRASTPLFQILQAYDMRYGD